jgi:hypothetical protein
MYGLIHNGLKSMIVEKFGENQWHKVLSTSGVSEDSFLTMSCYDDSITYSLLGPVSDVLGAPLEACLEMFGEYFILEIATKSYDQLLNATGQDMIEFLSNTNALHDRITSTFHNYTPPEFFLETKENHHLLHYLSQREGLTPFVVGLIKGIAKRFDSTVTIISQSEVPSDHGEHTVFELEIGTT